MAKQTKVYKPKIDVTIDPDMFLPVYRHLLVKSYDIEFLWGSRDSGKSRDVAQRKIIRCLGNPHFKCAMIRKVANTVVDSQYALIKSVCEEWNIDHLFKFTTSPQPKIVCANGGVFLGRGMDDPKKIKSMTDPTDAWIEEGSDFIEDDWTIITTSLRSNNANVQIDYSFNPDIPGGEAFEDFWLFKRYFCELNGEPIKDLSFTRTITERLEDGTKAEITYRATHSTFYDNPYCPPARKVYYEGLGRVSDYWHRVYCLGLWARRKTGGEFLKGFEEKIHANQILSYNPHTTIHISIDSNVYPHIAVTCWQLEKTVIDFKTVWDINQIHELPAEDPENTASAAARKIIRWLQQIGYSSTVYWYGDRSTKARNNIDDAKRSFFQIIDETLISNGYRTKDMIHPYAPPVRSIGEFVNAILIQELTFARIRISKACKQSINDYLETKTDKDGSILKIRKSDYEGGPSYEHNGHLTDTLKDFIYQAFSQEYASYVNKHNRLIVGGLTTVSRGPKVTL
jgi:PBSX family phage terminase large subunit